MANLGSIPGIILPWVIPEYRTRETTEHHLLWPKPNNNDDDNNNINYKAVVIKIVWNWNKDSYHTNETECEHINKT